MLETISLIVSLFLLPYSVRSLLFLYWSEKYYRLLDRIPFLNSFSKTGYRNRQDEWVTFNDNVPLSDKLEIEKETCMPLLPFVSILVATKNEQFVIDHLLDSINKLTYDRTLYEIIIVDDSTDSTFELLEKWKKQLTNLKIIKRSQCVGWKGGALNVALKSLRADSRYVIVVDADVILPCNIIEKFIDVAAKRGNEECAVVQGYCIPNNNSTNSSNSSSSNWVSKGITFRLAQRNMIEFFAKDKLNLPLQVTGSLFMIKSSILKQIGFSNDLCEDWDLTLQLYLSEHPMTSVYNENKYTSKKSHIFFYEKLNATNQAPNSFRSYFKQRLRVSEGHTRGYIKMLPYLVKSIQPLRHKLEITFIGLNYLKSTFIFSLLMINLCAIIIADLRISSPVWITSLIIQSSCAASVLLFNVKAVAICGKKKQCNSTHLLSKLFLDICTLPALVTGSMLGITRKKGRFYGTQRIRNL